MMFHYTRIYIYPTESIRSRLSLESKIETQRNSLMGPLFINSLKTFR